MSKYATLTNRRPSVPTRHCVDCHLPIGSDCIYGDEEQWDTPDGSFLCWKSEDAMHHPGERR